MTDSELLDRRIEQLVVDTVKRELRKGGIGGAVQAVQGLDTQGLARGIRFDQTSDETLEQHIKVVQETGQTVAGLTESVLLESLRRANARAGEYARELSKLSADNQSADAQVVRMAGRITRLVKQLDEAQKIGARLVDERDQAQRKADTMQSDLDSARADATRWHRAYNELAKETA
jgi:uncharacterized coiled-coil DUF342 family protein